MVKLHHIQRSHEHYLKIYIVLEIQYIIFTLLMEKLLKLDTEDGNYIYEVHTISFQTFFQMGTFIDSTHMKL